MTEEKTPREMFQDAALWAAVNYLPLQVSFKIRLSPQDEWIERSFPIIFSNGMVFSDNDEVAELLAAAQKFQYAALCKEADLATYSQQDMLMLHIRGALILRKETAAKDNPFYNKAFQDTVISGKKYSFCVNTLPGEDTNTDIHVDSLDAALRQTITYTNNDEENGTVLFMRSASGYIWDTIANSQYENFYFRVPNQLPCLFMMGTCATYHSAQVPSSMRTASICNSMKIYGVEISDLCMRVVAHENGPKNIRLIFDNEAYMNSKAHFRKPEKISEPFIA